MTSNFLSALNQTMADSVVKEPNQYQEHELAITGKIFLQALDAESPCVDFLKTHHFQDAGLGFIYDYCLKSYSKNGMVSKVALIEALKDFFQSDIDYHTFLQHVAVHGCINDKLAKAFAFEIDENFRKKQIINCLKQVYDQMACNIKDITLTEANKKLDDMAVEIAKLAFNQVEKKIFTHEEVVEKFWQDFKTGSEPVIATGIKDLDEMIGGGFGQGELIILAGRPGMGKTALLIDIMGNIAENEKNILSFSIEMTENQSTARFISRELLKSKNIRLPYSKILSDMRSSDAKDRENLKYIDAEEKSRDNIKKICHNFTPSIDVNYIVSYAKRYAESLQREGKRLDFIAIDYLQIFDFSENENLRIGITKATYALKQLSKTLNVPVLLLAQLNRDVNKERSIEDRKPQLHHLKDSGSIEQDADKVLFSFRPNYYENNIPKEEQQYLHNYLEILISKNRNGEQGVVPVNADMACNHFTAWDSRFDGKTISENFE